MQLFNYKMTPPDSINLELGFQSQSGLTMDDGRTSNVFQLNIHILHNDASVLYNMVWVLQYEF